MPEPNEGEGLTEWTWDPDGMSDLVCVDDETQQPTMPTYYLCTDVDTMLARLRSDAAKWESAFRVKTAQVSALIAAGEAGQRITDARIAELEAEVTRVRQLQAETASRCAGLEGSILAKEERIAALDVAHGDYEVKRIAALEAKLARAIELVHLGVDGVSGSGKCPFCGDERSGEHPDCPAREFLEAGQDARGDADG